MKKTLILLSVAAFVFAPAVVAGEKTDAKTSAAASAQCSGGKSACCAAKKEAKTVRNDPLAKGATLLATR